MRQDPADIIYDISSFLRTKGEGEEVTVAEVAEATRHHRATVKKYLGIIRLVHNRAPQLEELDGRIKISRLPSDLAELDETEVILTSLYFKKAVRQEQAIQKEDWMRSEVLEKMKGMELIDTVGEKFFLTSLGLSSAMLTVRDAFNRGIDTELSGIEREKDKEKYRDPQAVYPAVDSRPVFSNEIRPPSRWSTHYKKTQKRREETPVMSA
ncbi:hypothetical protein AKJ42_03780 [candidate division MSBL1 archaeon SCGC-AAA261C02]|uniref:Uncharacterized protein n=1 Tax=candidate division MSBL1 archaeon SCGC-AAA261C02 TaxID=1698272 RepID=A0A133UY29_9EURY|nr:hypothetical protein AKJ42_03780 [candidate division MSBL1 archaeon SCGC-AAA261C02]